MICEYCHKGNRSIAKFCKWCGKPISNQNLLEKMVGQAEVKAQLKSIVDTYTYLGRKALDKRRNNWRNRYW